MAYQERGDHPGPPGDTATPVVTICSLTEEQRTAAAGSVLLDLDHGIQLSFDLQVDRGVIRRRVHDLSGVIEDTLVPMEHSCATCSLREEVVGTVLTWSDQRRPLLVAMPPGAEPASVIEALLRTSSEQPRRLSVGQVLAVVDAGGLMDDVFGDDLLVERGLAFTDDDRRSVGEVVSHQLEYADVVGYPSTPSDRASALLDHLVVSAVTRRELHQLSGTDLLLPRPVDRARHVVGSCVDPGPDRAVRPTGADHAHGVWTVELTSDRPLSPDRLRDEITVLGSQELRGRGYFWLPTRPELRCVWDGAGGQLSIGPAGGWDGDRQTRLVITGVEGDPRAVRAAFERALLTDAEYVAGADFWMRVDDGMDPWLGVRTGR